MKRASMAKKDLSLRIRYQIPAHLRKCETSFSKLYDLMLLSAALLIIFLLPN